MSDSAPNILLIVLDAVRKDHLTSYGYERQTTPRLSEFTNQATRYDDAVAAAPWTPSSHGAMFSGRYPSNSQIYGRTPNYGTEQPHVAELLANAGYATYGFSNSYHTSPERGFDRGFEYYHDILSLPRIAGKMWEPSLDYLRHLIDYFGRGYDDSSFQLRRLKSRLERRDEPFFAFINLNSAHSPYDPPAGFKSVFESRFEQWDEVDRERARIVSDDAYKYMLGDVDMASAEWELLKCWYDGEIRYLDFLLGNVFEYLREHDLYEDTMIVVTSDHGEQFGENGLVYHQFSLADVLINVPLLIKWPGQQSQADSSELVSLVDLAPTFCDQASIDDAPKMDGRSLASETEPSEVFAEYAGPNESLCQRFTDRFEDPTEFIRGLQAVRTDDYKLVHGSDESSTLYDVTGESERVCENESVRTTLQNELDHELAPLPEGGVAEELEGHVENHLREMGYL